MGNSVSNLPTKSNQDSHLDSPEYEIYELIGRKGDGKLIDTAKKANKTKNFNELDEYIQTQVSSFLYNDGEGKMVFSPLILKY